MIKKCDTPNCTSPFQDKRYGGKRVMNKMPSQGKVPQARCTVCGKEMVISKKSR